MPHASEESARRIEDPAFGATDEVKVYKDEGEDEKPENLSEEKFGLVTETEEVTFVVALMILLIFSLYIRGRQIEYRSVWLGLKRSVFTCVGCR